MKVSCATRTSTLKIYAPRSQRLGPHGQLPYAFKLFVDRGDCKAPSALGRQFVVLVDGHLVATLRTGANGVIRYLVRLTSGHHVITAEFKGNRDLGKSTSRRVVTHAI